MRSLAERIEEKCTPADENGCVIWTGHVSSLGTPTITHRKRTLSARRARFECTQETTLPRNRMVVMTCGNRLCLAVLHMDLKPVNDPVTRFWENVRKSDGCWEWTAYRTTAKSQRHRGAVGYGRFMVTWRRVILAHRYSWELHNGLVPDGMVVCHHCDNPACVRPDHLFVGTQKDNIQDMLKKGRARNKWSGRVQGEGADK